MGEGDLRTDVLVERDLKTAEDSGLQWCVVERSRFLYQKINYERHVKFIFIMK